MTFTVQESMEERFWGKVVRSNCWIWSGSKNANGYGTFAVGSRVNGTRRGERAHRIAWVLTYGKIPKSKHVLHRCDNPPCVNPNHLFLGTQRDNLLDASRKGRISHLGRPSVTRCRNGHLRKRHNTVVYRVGMKRHKRDCLECRYIRYARAK